METKLLYVYSCRAQTSSGNQWLAGQFPFLVGWFLQIIQGGAPSHELICTAHQLLVVRYLYHTPQWSWLESNLANRNNME